MAQVFLSYDREDAPKARVIAQSLERAGHFVWFDLHIKGGAEYGKVIEEALEAADAVVVLWSTQSVQSAWVRDEAAAGRDKNCLIPILIEPINPPMGFRQYQNLDFSKWSGNGKPQRLADLLASIEALVSTQSEPSAVQTTATKQTKPKAHKLPRWVVVAGAVTLAIVAIGLFVGLFLNAPRKAVRTVAVAAADPGPASSALARDLFVKLGSLQAVDTTPIELIEQNSGRKPDFTFRISAPETGHANVTLTTHETLLWSKAFERPANQIGDLNQQIAVSAGRVLECATEAASSGELDQQTLRIYLNGCAALSEMAWTDFRSLVPVFRQVTEKAPDFEGGWSHLLLTQSYVVGWETLPGDAPEAAALRDTIAQARRKFPKIAAAYWADYLLNIRDLRKKGEVIQEGIRVHPDNPLILSTYSGFLQSVGRMQEATKQAKRAAELSPLSPEETGNYINILGWAGKPELALAELDKAEQLWPGARNLVDARWRFHLRYGDPRVALEITRAGIADYGDYESYLVARIDPSTHNVARAIADARAQIGRRPRATGSLVQTLVEFGREDEAYAILDKASSPEDAEWLDAFFRPAFRKFRHDSRFIRLTARFGYVDYWKKSGKWPDFCFEPDLPYDCKAEAAKLS